MQVLVKPSLFLDVLQNKKTVARLDVLKAMAKIGEAERQVPSRTHPKPEGQIAQKSSKISLDPH